MECWDTVHVADIPAKTWVELTTENYTPSDLGYLEPLFSGTLKTSLAVLASSSFKEACQGRLHVDRCNGLEHSTSLGKEQYQDMAIKNFWTLNMGKVVRYPYLKEAQLVGTEVNTHVHARAMVEHAYGWIKRVLASTT
ncbi:hypothetical protein CALVIDRAFT_569771 [Calocera viscosa TUFC12733]|uniref:Uncharacterized protein n=1 Tax=Calocera viscosa (strain TUFC12733) TaxID=1330018 RepID=A0A167FLA2_CALVF|nr:hypothetical protein CALVIDRAFT_569771 [Calocera viscosa TUFC12733]